MESLNVALITGFHPYANNFNGVAPNIWNGFLDENEGIVTNNIRYGNFNSVVNDVSLGLIDVGVGPFSITTQRMGLVEYSRPFSTANVTIFYRPEETSNIKPVVILASIILVIFIVFTLISMFMNEQPFFIAIYNSFVTFLRRDVLVQNPVSIPQHIVNMIWVFVAFLTLAGAIGYLATLFVSPVAPIKGRSDFGGDTIGYIEGTFYPEIIQQINAIPYPVYSIEEALDLLASGEIDGYIDDKDIVSFVMKNNNYNFESSTTIKADEYCFIARYGLDIIDRLDRYIIRSREDGRTEIICNESMGYVQPLCYL